MHRKNNLQSYLPVGFTHAVSRHQAGIKGSSSCALVINECNHS
jgi:hypothetical protein